MESAQPLELVTPSDSLSLSFFQGWIKRCREDVKFIYSSRAVELINDERRLCEYKTLPIPFNKPSMHAHIIAPTVLFAVFVANNSEETLIAIRIHNDPGAGLKKRQ